MGIGHPYDAYPWTKVNVEIYNVRGERVVRLIDGGLVPAGNHTIIWDGTDHRGQRVTTGGYIYQLTGCGETLTQKMALVV